MAKYSAILEHLIIFYINMKHNLQIKKVDKDGFLDQMIKYCKEKGFNKHSDDVMKNVWMTLVSKYLSLKSEGTTEEKENWKYFEILDSCYEELDFSKRKFTEDMVWLMIESYLKRRGIEDTHKIDIITEIHKDFLKYGYTRVSRRLIRDKWKSLKLKYEVFKNDPEKLAKMPYLQAINAVEEGECTVNMAFTTDLTQRLIKYFTQLKVSCIIHGYDSDKVLHEIQSKFNDMAVNFSKEDIEDKWRQLTNIYRFLNVKGKNETGWIYFDSMKNHFKDDFSFTNSKTNDEDLSKQDKKWCLRPRSKSVGPEPAGPVLLKLSAEETHFTKHKSVKRSHRNHEKTSPCKKSKDTILEKASCEVTEDCVEKKVLPNAAQIPSNDSSAVNKERRESTVHIINIDESDIDRKNGNFTINIPSITKQFSDNEYLPLKKRLRLNGDNGDHSNPLEKIKQGLVGFESDFLDNENQLKDMGAGTNTIEEEIVETLGITGNKKPQHVQANGAAYADNRTDYFILDKLNESFGKQCKAEVSETDNQENVSLQKCVSPNTSPQQSPVLFLVIKVDGRKNPKNRTFGGVNTSLDEPSQPDGSDNLKNQASSKVKEKAIELCNLQTDEYTYDAVRTEQEPPVCETFIKPVKLKSKSEVCKKGKYVRKETCSTDTSEVEIVSDSFDGVRSQFNMAGNERVTIQNESNCGSSHAGNEKIIDFHSPSVDETEEYTIQNDSFVEGIPTNLSTKKLHTNCSTNTPTGIDVSRKVAGTNRVKRSWPGFKFISHVIKPPTTQNTTDGAIAVPPSIKSDSKFLGNHSLPVGCGRTEDFDEESVYSEAVGEDDGLKDNLLATVIDFQEQNNSEFVEIKNLMKQNNLLQRETNRLLRLLIEQM